MSLPATASRWLGGATAAVAAAVLALTAFLWQTWPPSPSFQSSSSNDAFGLPPLILPVGVTLQKAQVELGRQLFFDRRLSFNETMSCAMCHVPEEGFASNASKTSVGIEGKSLMRNAPGLFNVAWQKLLFHDGREASLVTQAWSPLLHPDEMANPSVSHVLERIASLPHYQGRFERAFPGRTVSMDTVGAALAAYQVTLVSANSRFDRWRYASQANALSEPEQRGFVLFTGKARCVACHQIGDKHALLSDGLFHVTGIGFATPPDVPFVVPLGADAQTLLSQKDLTAFVSTMSPDLGRFEITHLSEDRYAFKTPSLRNLTRSAPYMHDGSLPTLEAVVDFFDRGGGDEVPGKSPLLQALHLTRTEKQDLVAFLRSLDGTNAAALGARPPPF